MTGLIRSDYRRIFKDRLFTVVCIIGVAFALVMPLLYFLLFNDVTDPMLKEMAASYTTAKSQFFTAFATTDNFGLIVPILLAIILCKDFSYGTVRNKIISGKSRTSVFMSLYITCFTALFGVMLLNAALTLGFSLIFFKYSDSGFDILYFLQSILFEMLVYMFIAAVISWLCVAMKNVGLVIVVYASVTIALMMIFTFLQISIQILETNTANEQTVKIIETVQRLNIFTYYSHIGHGTSYTLTDTLYFTLTPIAGTAIMLLLGLLKFNKKDLK